MPNWCYNAVVFFQEDGNNDRLQLLIKDLKQYVNYKKSTSTGWIGALLEAKGLDITNITTRAFIVYMENFESHVQIELESAWRPMPTGYKKIAELYNLKYVYLAEEPSEDLHINTDVTGRYFTTRYVLKDFQMDEIKEEIGDVSKYEAELKSLKDGEKYFDSLDELTAACEGFQIEFKTFADVKAFLNKFGISMFEYERDDSAYRDEEEKAA